MSIVPSLPYSIAAGQLVSAVPVMGNFTALQNYVNANAVPLAGPATLSGNFTINGSLTVTQGVYQTGGTSLTLAQFGGIPNDSSSATKAINTAALLAAIAFFTEQATAPLEGTNYSDAGTLDIGPGSWWFNAKLNLVRNVHFRGTAAPDGNSFGATRLIFPDGDHGIVIHNTSSAISNGVGTTGADGSILENLAIIPATYANTGAAPGLGTSIGVLLHARASVDRCTFAGWTKNGFGVIATAGGGGALEGNANGWNAYRIRCTQNGGDGIYVSGADANAGSCVRPDCSGNGGWGISDQSFLGNTYVAGHVAANTGGAYNTTGASARNALIGCYSEGGQPASSLVFPTVVIGGLHGAGFTGGTTAQMMLDGYQTATNFYQSNNFNSATERQLRFSASSSLVQIWDPNESGGNFPFRLQAKTGGSYWDWANNGSRLWELTNSQATVANGYPREVATRMGGAGGVGMRQGFFLGMNMKFIGTGTSAPASGTYVQGDFVLNETPSEAGSGGSKYVILGWTCTVAGTPGTWLQCRTLTGN